jgi:hypothetical protein
MVWRLKYFASELGLLCSKYMVEVKIVDFLKVNQFGIPLHNGGTRRDIKWQMG